MRIFYQGRLDFFCGIYAVLNALQFLFDLSLHRAREIFADRLAELSRHEALWRATLRNETDFYWLVGHMLAVAERDFPLRVTRPFAPGAPPFSGRPDALGAARLHAPELERESGADMAAVWGTLAARLPENPEQKLWAVVLRFHRYVSYLDLPVVSHWSCGTRMLGDILVLRDASKEEGALHSLAKGETALRKQDVSPARPLLVEPQSLFFLQRL